MRLEASDKADIDKTLPAFTLVEVDKFYGDWALICREGSKQGYVPAKAVQKTN